MVGHATLTMRSSIGLPSTSFAVTYTHWVGYPDLTPTHRTETLSDPTCGWAPVPWATDQITSARSLAARFMTLPVIALTVAFMWCWSGAKALCSAG